LQTIATVGERASTDWLSDRRNRDCQRTRCSAPFARCHLRTQRVNTAPRRL